VRLPARPVVACEPLALPLSAEVRPLSSTVPRRDERLAFHTLSFRHQKAYAAKRSDARSAPTQQAEQPSTGARTFGIEADCG
jgi:hypothetical protein